MRTLLLTISLFGIIDSLYSQTTFDVRKVNWGMTIQEVISSEYPLTPQTKGNEVEFYNVDIGNSFTARLIYEFSNGRLIKLKYIVYGYKSQYTRGTCDFIIPLFDKVRYSTFIFDALKTKNYKCNMGWYTPNGKHLADLTNNKQDYWNCSTDETTVKKVDAMAQSMKAERVAVGFENERSSATFYFNEHQNYKSQYDSEFKMSCDSDFYNTYFWLEIKPNYKVEKGMKGNDF
jgi:hypothetical protein